MDVNVVGCGSCEGVQWRERVEVRGQPLGLSHGLRGSLHLLSLITQSHAITFSVHISVIVSRFFWAW